MKSAVVVGSGIAGLVAALELRRSFQVTLVNKAKLADSNACWAQGGIAVAMFADDSVQKRVEDTLRAGAEPCHSHAVEVLCVEGPKRIRDLIRLGVASDSRDGELARRLEAAHARDRVPHTGIERNGKSLRAGGDTLAFWKGEAGTVEQRETAKLLTPTRVNLAAATAREELRGAHFRTDFPEPSAVFAHPLCFCAKVASSEAVAC